MSWHRADDLSRRIATIPGVGPIDSTMLSMKAPPAETFKSGRQFAAWLGLTPKDHSAGSRPARRDHEGRRPCDPIGSHRWSDGIVAPRQEGPDQAIAVAGGNIRPQAAKVGGGGACE